MRNRKKKEVKRPRRHSSTKANAPLAEMAIAQIDDPKLWEAERVAAFQRGESGFGWGRLGSRTPDGLGKYQALLLVVDATIPDVTDGGRCIYAGHKVVEQLKRRGQVGADGTVDIVGPFM